MEFLKSGKIEKSVASDEDIKLINKYTLTPLMAEDLFVFKVIACDNETDDRNFMPFSLKALKELARLYPGKTVIKDHNTRTCDGQLARVYSAEVETVVGKTTKAGEPFSRLILKCYMPKDGSNSYMIADIKAGIKREVSVHGSWASLICNICGKDNARDYCTHMPGRKYEDKVCQLTINHVTEAYELSFVTVGAQPRAATVKAIEDGKIVQINLEKLQKALALAQIELEDKYLETEE